MVVFAFHWKAGIDPVLLSFGVIAYVRITHSRQFTGGVI